MPLGVLVSEMPPMPPRLYRYHAMRTTANAAAPLGVYVWNAANAVPPLQVSAIWELLPTPLRHLGCKCLNCCQSRPAFTGLCNENYRKRRHAATRGVSFWNAVYAAAPLQVYLITNMLSSESHTPTHFSWCSYMRDGPILKGFSVSATMTNHVTGRKHFSSWNTLDKTKRVLHLCRTMVNWLRILQINVTSIISNCSRFYAQIFT